MSIHLDAAKRALADASGLDPSDVCYQDLLVIAQVQARVAAADALTRLADRFAPITEPPAPSTYQCVWCRADVLTTATAPCPARDSPGDPPLPHEAF